MAFAIVDDRPAVTVIIGPPDKQASTTAPPAPDNGGRVSSGIYHACRRHRLELSPTLLRWHLHQESKISATCVCTVSYRL